MRFVSRLLLLAGAGAMAVSVLLTWVTIDGPSIALGLPLIGAEVSPRSRTIAGTDTALWPVVVAIAAVVAILGLLGVARRLLSRSACSSSGPATRCCTTSPTPSRSNRTTAGGSSSWSPTR